MGQYTASQLQALVLLLGDDDAHTVGTARSALLSCWVEARPYVEAGSEHPDTRVRGRCRGILAEQRLEDLAARWQQLAAQPGTGMDLETGCRLVAETEYPHLDTQSLSADLDALADGCRGRIKAAGRLEDQVRVLCQFLGEEQGFRGGEYYDPDNSYLNKVLERRTGIQIAVSTVYLLVGQRLDLPLRGMGLPGHYMVLAQLPGEPTYIDAHGGGRVWSRPQCLEYLRGLGPGIQLGPLGVYLQPTSTRRTLARMLVNLINIYSQRNDETRTDLYRRWLDILAQDR